MAMGTEICPGSLKSCPTLPHLELTPSGCVRFSKRRCATLDTIFLTIMQWIRYLAPRKTLHV